MLNARSSPNINDVSWVLEQRKPRVRHDMLVLCQFTGIPKYLQTPLPKQPRRREGNSSVVPLCSLNLLPETELQFIDGPGDR